MTGRITRRDRLLVALVFGHLGVAFAHGRAHQGASVALSPAGNAFVLVVIIIGPLVGLAWSWLVNRRAGGWMIAATMTGALVFGIVNHFVLMSGDHVSQVDTAWRGLFESTAILLAFLEAIGAGVSVWRLIDT
jgi:hypothetical protein